MRLFAAVFPPAEALEPVHDVVRRLRPGLPQLTWVARELWHVTLAFYGEVAEHDVAALRKRVAAAADGHGPMQLAIEGGGCFPRDADPRVIWSGVTGDLPALGAVAAAVAADDRPFHPHLTLARVRRRPADVAPLMRALDGVHGPQFAASEIVLMRSDAGSGGAPRHYTPLAQFTLDARRLR